MAGEYRLDLKRVVVVGHSSGGQLAQWMGARGKLPKGSAVYAKEPLAVKAVMNLDGPPDLVGVYLLERQICGVPAVTQFLGGTPGEVPERYRQGAATEWMPLGMPQWIVAGGLLQMAKDTGEVVKVMRLEGAGHFDMLAPEGPHGKPVVEALLKLVE